MNKKEFKMEKTDLEPISKLFDNDEIKIKGNAYNCCIYGEKRDFINEDIFIKEKEEIDINYIGNDKSSIDLNLSEKKLHEFLNDDLIKALDNNLMNPHDICDKSDLSNSNAYISESSNYTSQENSPTPNIKISKKDIKDLNTNLDKENYLIINTNDVNISLDVNINKNKINLEKNVNIIEEEKEEKTNNLEINIKDKIKMQNDLLFAPMIIPNNENNEIGEKKLQKEKGHKKESKESEGKKKNNSLKNKFDDDIEPIIMLSMTNFEEKTKLPLEIRTGDWICLYCNNLNFSFRIKCNRCGLLRKSSTQVLKKIYCTSKYQYKNNFSNYNGTYNMNFNSNNY